MFAALNNRYVQAGVLRLAFGILTVLLLFFMKWALDGTLPDRLGMYSMVAAPVCLVVWLIQCIRRDALKKKILQHLETNDVELP